VINNLDQKYLPQIIRVIRKYVPNLLDIDAAQAGGIVDIEINVDNLQPGVLRELDALIKTLLAPACIPPQVAAPAVAQQLAPTQFQAALLPQQAPQATPALAQYSTSSILPPAFAGSTQAQSDAQR